LHPFCIRDWTSYKCLHFFSVCCLRTGPVSPPCCFINPTDQFLKTRRNPPPAPFRIWGPGFVLWSPVAWFSLWTRYNHTDYDPCFIHQRKWLWNFHPINYYPCFIHQECGCDIFIQETKDYGIIWPIDSQCWYSWNQGWRLWVTTRVLIANQSAGILIFISYNLQKSPFQTVPQLRWHMDPHYVIGGSLSADFSGTNFAFFTTKKIGKFWKYSSINITNLLKFLGKIRQIFSITKLKIKTLGLCLLFRI
jgi:hypothetical protein